MAKSTGTADAPGGVHIALLRGINVGGRNRLGMPALREMFAKLGFRGAQSVLQSGNVVFSSAERTGVALEELLERETARRFDLKIDYIVRSVAEVGKTINQNPFPRAATSDPSHLVVDFLKQAPTSARLDELRAAIRGPESIECIGEQLYITYPEGIGDSKLTAALIDRILGISGTARNWNTVRKLASL